MYFIFFFLLILQPAFALYNPDSFDKVVYDLTFFSLNNEDLLLGIVTPSGFYYKKITSDKFISCNFGLVNTYLTTILYHKKSLYIGGDSGIYRAVFEENKIKYWEEVAPILGVKVLAANDKYLFAGTTLGLFLSRDGKSWYKVKKGRRLKEAYISSILCEGKKVWVGTIEEGLYYSHDDGDSFHLVENFPYLKIHSFATLKFATYTRLYLGCNKGVFYTEYPENSPEYKVWESFNKGLSTDKVLCLATDKNNLYVGSYLGGVFISEGGEKVYYPINTGLGSTIVFKLLIKEDLIYGGTKEGLYERKKEIWKKIF